MVVPTDLDTNRNSRIGSIATTPVVFNRAIRGTAIPIDSVAVITSIEPNDPVSTNLDAY